MQGGSSQRKTLQVVVVLPVRQWNGVQGKGKEGNRGAGVDLLRHQDLGAISSRR